MNLLSLQARSYVPYNLSLGTLELASLQQRPEDLFGFLYQELHDEAARTHWEDSL